MPHLLLSGFHESCHTAASFFLKWRSEMSGHLCLVANLSDYRGFPTNYNNWKSIYKKKKKVKGFSFILFYVES